MPRAARFFSYIPQAPQGQQWHGRAIPTDEEAPLDAALFSTFAIYQRQNQLNLSQTRTAMLIDEDYASPEAITASSSHQQEEIPELNKAFVRLYTRFRNKYDLQFPDTPCAYCSQLLLPRNIIWKSSEPGYEYPLSEKLQILPIMQIKNGREHVAICKTCKTKVIPDR